MESRSRINNRCLLTCPVALLHSNSSADIPGVYRLYSVSQKKSPPPRDFLAFFPKRLGIFCPNFTRLLYVPIYARPQIFI